MRKECRGSLSSGYGEPARLLLGGRPVLQALPTGQKVAAEALLAWMAQGRSPSAADEHGDHNDGAEDVSEALLDRPSDLPKAQPPARASNEERSPPAAQEGSKAGAGKSVAWLTKLPLGSPVVPFALLLVQGSHIM